MPAAARQPGSVAAPVRLRALRQPAGGGGAAWTGAALAMASVVAIPILAVIASLAAPARDVWAHLIETQLLELAVNTVLLLLGVGIGVLGLGTSLAWLVVNYRFPGRGLFEWALILPFAVPAYVIGFVFLGLLDFTGPVQSTLREVFGPGIVLPPIRSRGGVILVMTLVFYPYVYTLARAAFLEQAADTLEAAHGLGRTGLSAFITVTLPMARPSLVSGLSLALMETLADFGTVATFGYRTFTEAIYRVWHGMFDRLAATQLAVVLLGFAGLLLWLEYAFRGRARYTQHGRHGRLPAPVPLRSLRAAAATGACVLVLGLAFALPLTQLSVWAWGTLASQGLPKDFGAQLWNSVWLATVTAACACSMAIILAYASRLHRSPAVTLSARFAAMGYALPGSVIAVGVLLPLGWLDHVLAAVLRASVGAETGLILTGSAVGLVFAYLVRFLAVSFQSVDASLTKIPGTFDEAARSLGARAGRTLRAIHLPLMRRGLLAALALVFVDVMKEMPATLLLRPFELNTLAIGVWQRTTESQWEEAAVPALAIVAAGLFPVALTMRMISRVRRR